MTRHLPAVRHGAQPGWEVVDLPPVAQQRRSAAPAGLAAYLTAITDLLGQDPALVTAAFQVRHAGDDLVLYFPASQGFLRYRVVDQVAMVYLVELCWL
jgi:hypothetical protein